MHAFSGSPLDAVSICLVNKYFAEVSGSLCFFDGFTLNLWPVDNCVTTLILLTNLTIMLYLHAYILLTLLTSYISPTQRIAHASQ